MKLIYLNIGISSVFDSQILALLHYYVEVEIIDEVVLLFGYKDEKEKNIIKKKNLNKINVLFFKVFPNYSVFNLLNYNSLSKVLESNFEDYTNCYFHVRTELTSFYLKNVITRFNISTDQILPDIRGATYEEVKEFYGTSKLLSPLKLYNYTRALKGLKDNKNISVVSDALKDYILKKNSDIKKENIYVTPCLAGKDFYFDSEKRKEIRKKLNIKSNEVLLVFASGGTANWQKNEMIFKLADKGFKVLNLSKKKIEHINIINIFVSYSEVSAYLSASDIAFIWRDKSIVNKVASPVKISEYLSCGLPVIHNNTIDMLLKMSKNNSLKFFPIDSIDELDQHEIQHFIKKIDRNQISKAGISIFGIKEIVEKYLKIYNKNDGNEKRIE